MITPDELNNEKNRMNKMPKSLLIKLESNRFYS